MVKRRMYKCDETSGKFRLETLAALPYVLSQHVCEDGSAGYECRPWGINDKDVSSVQDVMDKEKEMLVNLMPMQRWAAYLETLKEVSLSESDAPPLDQSGVEEYTKGKGWQTTPYGKLMAVGFQTKDEETHAAIAMPITGAEATFALNTRARESLIQALKLQSNFSLFCPFASPSKMTPLQSEQLLVACRGWRTGFKAIAKGAAALKETEVTKSDFYSTVQEALRAGVVPPEDIRERLEKAHKVKDFAKDHKHLIARLPDFFIKEKCTDGLGKAGTVIAKPRDLFWNTPALKRKASMVDRLRNSNFSCSVRKSFRRGAVNFYSFAKGGRSEQPPSSEPEPTAFRPVNTQEEKGTPEAQFERVKLHGTEDEAKPEEAAEPVHSHRETILAQVHAEASAASPKPTADLAPNADDEPQHTPARDSLKEPTLEEGKSITEAGSKRPMSRHSIDSEDMVERPVPEPMHVMSRPPSSSSAESEASSVSNEEPRALPVASAVSDGVAAAMSLATTISENAGASVEIAREARMAGAAGIRPDENIPPPVSPVPPATNGPQSLSLAASSETQI